MEIKNRKNVVDELAKYDYLRSSKNDFVEVTEWANGEGYDVNICVNGNIKSINLTQGELEAINYLVKTLEYQNK